MSRSTVILKKLARCSYKKADHDKTMSSKQSSSSEKRDIKKTRKTYLSKRDDLRRASQVTKFAYLQVLAEQNGIIKLKRQVFNFPNQ